MKIIATMTTLGLALAAIGCGSASGSEGSSGSTEASTEAATAQQKTRPHVKVPQGAPPKHLVIKEIEAGSGEEAKAGDEVTVQYVGVSYKSGKEFDASWDRGEPFSFKLGAGMVIPGWDKGVQGMKVGGRRELIIPPNLAYGTAGAPPAIGPNETLVFVIDLEKIG